MGKKDRQRQERRRRRKQAIWQGSDPDNLFAGLATQFNSNLKCGWCGFPARPYGGFDEEPDAVMIRELPGSPEGGRLPVHMACMDSLQAAVTSDDKDWKERVRPYYVEDGII